jgi:hypothetical protein
MTVDPHHPTGSTVMAVDLHFAVSMPDSAVLECVPDERDPRSQFFCWVVEPRAV